MTDTDIRDALAQATRDVAAPPDLLDRVRAGGRRRVVRRRSVLAAGLAAAATGAGAAVWRAPGGPDRTPPASARLDRPTRGDLAGDRAFLDAVRAAWRRHVGAGLPTVGEPHVAWAGDTPGGPVALVAQRTRTRVVSEAGQIEYGLTGFVVRTGGEPSVTSMESMLTGAANSAAVLTGPAFDVLVVMDEGRPVEFSPDLTYGADGSVRRTFRPLVFDRDGAAMRQGPAPALRTGQQRVDLANPTALAEGRRGDLRHRTLDRTLPGSAAAWPAGVPKEWDLRDDERYDDRYGYHVYRDAAAWFIRGATADGRRLVVQSLTVGDRPDRLFLLLGRPDEIPEPVYLGAPDPRAALPVRVRLPGSQGVVVAAEGATLRYRVPDGTWLPAGGDAALLPAAATEAEVTRPGRTPVTVALPA
jgi:hypothetical protein